MSSIYPNIEIFGVYDRGVPNQERIVLRVNSPTSLNNYFLFLGYSSNQNENTVWPYTDNFLWLTGVNMDVPGWIFVYTGKGTPSISSEKITKQPLQTLYWNKESVVLENFNIFPALSSFGPIEIGNKPNKSLANDTLPPLGGQTTSDFIKALTDRYLDE